MNSEIHGREAKHVTTNGNIGWIANYIWGIANDVLRDLYVRGKYRDVILPMTVLRRLDAVLEDTKQAVLDVKASLDAAGVVAQDQALRHAAGQAFYNTSPFTLRDLRARASRQQLRADFEAYLDGFSPNVQDILDSFEFRNQVPRLSKADALGTLIEKLTSHDINLSPAAVMNTDGSVRHAALDNHGMGTIFEELVRRYNEENNEEAGEHWTPRDAVFLMARLLFLPVADEIKSGTYLLYDGACGTGGMLTVAEETLQQLAAEDGKQVSTHLYGQEMNAETYAICKADLLLKGGGEAADNIVGGPEHSTLANDAFPGREFDFMLSNPPYRVEKRAMQTIALPDEEAEVGPVPPGSGGGQGEAELDPLSNIIAEFNDLFSGIEWEDRDRVTRLVTKEIPSRVAVDTAFRNARENSDKANARIEHERALMRVMTAVMKDDTELFRQFADNEGFKRWMSDTVFSLAYEEETGNSAISTKAEIAGTTSGKEGTTRYEAWRYSSMLTTQTRLLNVDRGSRGEPFSGSG